MSGCLARPCLFSIYGENGGQAKNMAEMQVGIKNPGEFAKMQSPGEAELMKFCGASAPGPVRKHRLKGGFGVATPTSSGPEEQMSASEIWATGRYLPFILPPSE